MTDDKLEQIIGNLLRAGVMLAALVVLAGGGWYLATSGAGLPHFHHFHPANRGLRSIGSMPLAQGIIMAGLLLLIATPVARVAFSLVAFALERDRLYVVVTLIVLLVLLFSIGTAWL